MTRGGRLAAFLVLLPVACGGPTVTPRPPPGPAKAAPGEEGRVTVHVKGMSKRLNLV